MFHVEHLWNIRSRSSLVEQVQLFARLEPNRLAWRDRYLGARARIAPDASLSRFHGKYAKTAQFDPVARDEALLHRVEDGVHCRLGLGLRQAGTVDYPLNEILLDQVMSLSCATIYKIHLPAAQIAVILERLWAKVNETPVIGFFANT
jgi:hypothetical protein